MFLHRFVVIRKFITKGAHGKVGTWRENRVRDLQFFIHTKYMPVCCTGNEFVSICTAMHVSYGLDKHINKFLSMSMTMHMACGLDEHIKKYTNLIT